jgi:hypothetical protein
VYVLPVHSIGSKQNNDRRAPAEHVHSVSGEPRPTVTLKAAEWARKAS